MQVQICLYGDGGYGIGAAFEHFLCPNTGDFDHRFCPNCSFLKCRKGYVIGFEQFSSPKDGEFDQKILKNSNAAPLPTIPPPPLSKDWHLHNDNIFLIIFALAEFTNRIQSYPRMCLHHCHKNRFLPILLFVLLLSKVNNINPLSLLFTQNKSCILNSQSLIDHIVKRAICRKTR